MMICQQQTEGIEPCRQYHILKRRHLFKAGKGKYRKSPLDLVDPAVGEILLGEEEVVEQIHLLVEPGVCGVVEDT